MRSADFDSLSAFNDYRYCNLIIVCKGDINTQGIACQP